MCALPTFINASLNQTLSRTLLTSGTTMLAVLSLYVFGGESIRDLDRKSVVEGKRVDRSSDVCSSDLHQRQPQSDAEPHPAHVGNDDARGALALRVRRRDHPRLRSEERRGGKEGRSEFRCVLFRPSSTPASIRR